MAATHRTFTPGTFLFREGEPSRSMFLIQSGAVAIRKAKGTGYVEIGQIFSNQVLGELSFFDRLPRSATAVALSDVEALEIDFESLDKIYANVPDYMKSIIACVADRLRKANDTIRRLQKDLVWDDPDRKPRSSVGDSASDVLEATSEILGKLNDGSEDGGKKGG